MKNDLISRAALLEELNNLPEPGFEKTMPGMVALIKIKNAPAVDAKLVKHGIWEPEPYVFRCSECHKWLMLEQGDANMNFCPHCGARMDGRCEHEQP